MGEWDSGGISWAMRASFAVEGVGAVDDADIGGAGLDVCQGGADVWALDKLFVNFVPESHALEGLAGVDASRREFRVCKADESGLTQGLLQRLGSGVGVG